MTQRVTDDRRTEPADIPPVTGESWTRGEGCCKVERVATTYGLVGVDEELRRRYEAEDASLHELASYFNTRITAVTVNALETSIDTDPATVRAALQDETGVDPTRRDDIRASLAGKCDLERLTESYVSHETVRRHLNEHLSVSTDRGGFDTLEELEAQLESYEQQYANGIEGALERAVRTGLLEGDAFRVHSTRVECEQCSRTHRVGELLAEGGCDCHGE